MITKKEKISSHDSSFGIFCNAVPDCAGALLLLAWILKSYPFGEATVDDLHDRLVDLEIRYTHQAQLLDELNAVLTGACVRIDRLEQENRRLREQLHLMAADDYTLSPDE